MDNKTAWQRMALGKIYNLCKSQPRISANQFSIDIIKNPIKISDYLAIGGMIRIAQRNGWVKNTGRYVKAKTYTVRNRTNAGCLTAIWQSLIYKKA